MSLAFLFYKMLYFCLLFGPYHSHIEREICTLLHLKATETWGHQQTQHDCFVISTFIFSQVDANGVVVTNKWAFCQDERTLIYDGSGAGTFCPMPFLYNNQVSI